MLEQIRDIFVKANVFNNMLEDEDILINLDVINSPCKFILDESVRQERVVLNFYINEYKMNLIRLVEDLEFAARTPAKISGVKLPNNTPYSLYKDIILPQLEEGSTSTSAIDRAKGALLNQVKRTVIPTREVRLIIFREDYATREEYIAKVNSAIEENKDFIEIVEIYKHFDVYSPERIATDNLTCCHEIMEYLCPYDSKFRITDILEVLEAVRGINTTNSHRINNVVEDMVSVFGPPLSAKEWVISTITYHNLLEELDEYIKVVGVDNGTDIK